MLYILYIYVPAIRCPASPGGAFLRHFRGGDLAAGTTKKDKTVISYTEIVK